MGHIVSIEAVRISAALEAIADTFDFAPLRTAWNLLFFEAEIQPRRAVMESLARTRRTTFAVYSIGQGDRSVREDESMRLRVGSFGNEGRKQALRHRNARLRACIDAWSNATGRISVVVRTFRRATFDLGRASREMMNALRTLASSTWAALAPTPDIARAESTKTSLRTMRRSADEPSVACAAL